MKSRSLLILPVIALVIASCGNKDAQSGLNIPDDAVMVIDINAHSLSSKISWDEISQSNWFKEMARHTEDSSALKFLKDPASTGINTSSDIILYTKNQGNGSYMILAGSLNDANAFEQLCKTLHKDKEAEIKKEDGFNYMASENGAVVWSKTHFAFAGNSFLPGPSQFMKHAKRFPQEMPMRKKFTADSLKIFGIEALSVKDKNSLHNDKRFASLLKDSNDIHFWTKIDKFYAGIISSAVPMLDMGDLFEGTVAATSVNFDNGKISAKMKQYYNEKMSKLMSGYKAEPVSAATINRIPSSDVTAVIAVNFPPAAIKEFLQLTGKSEFIDMLLARLNFSIDDIIKATKGQLLISVSHPNTVNETKTKKSKGGNEMPIQTFKMDTKLLLATEVNDKASFEKMITTAKDFIKNMKKMKGGEGADTALPFNARIENNWFAASNSKEFADKFLAGGDNKFLFTEKITGHPIGVYVDLHKIGQSALRGADTSIKNKMGLLVMLEDIVATGGEYKDNATQFDFAINFSDKSTNSLKQLIRFMGYMKSSEKLEIKEVTLEDIRQEEDKPEPPPPPPPKKKAAK